MCDYRAEQLQITTNLQLPLFADHGMANIVHTCSLGHIYALIINIVPQMSLINEVFSLIYRDCTNKVFVQGVKLLP